MPRRPASFTQADVARAFRAAKAAGVRVFVEVKDGALRIVQIDDDVRPAATRPVEEPKDIVL